MSIMLGLMFSTSVYADIGTTSENCKNFTIKVHDDTNAEMQTIVNVNRIENASIGIVADFSKTVTAETNMFEALASHTWFGDGSAGTINVFKYPERSSQYRNTTNSINAAPILTANSNNLYKHKCSANKHFFS